MVDYEVASSFWDDKDDNSVKLQVDEILNRSEDIFNEYHNCVLATSYNDEVRSTPVDYTYYNGAFYIFSEGGRKFRALEHNKRVSLSVYDVNGNFGSLKSTQVMGIADFVEIYSEEYSKIAELRKIPLEGLRRLGYPMYLIKITPNEIILLDSKLKKEGYSSRQVWKRDN